ncbi:hypothetical protein KEM56_007107 [Ascosphaera pollenicola]|nr:hypothetical protein KEM56_007107 [Ascosphaera pollenicola]
MQEDNIFRTSSQFRLWSFTEDALRQVREATNAAACDRVRAAIRRSHDASNTQALDSGDGDTPMAGNDASMDGGRIDEQTIECLTADEEYKLVRHYCQRCMSLGDQYTPPLPTLVRATAVQYIRRFYLTNSPMTYHPRSIMPCALFLATKTENYYVSLRHFLAPIRNSTQEDIIAPEFLLTQGLRFTFDIRHPFRGLDGAVMELTNMARGEGVPGPHHPSQSPSSLQRAMQDLPPSSDSEKPGTSLFSRIAMSHHNAREILKSAAQFTDAYFLYTPSQIWLACLLLVDKPLAEFYLNAKLGSAAQSEGQELSDVQHQLLQIRAKLDTVLQKCADLLNGYLKTHTAETEEDRTRELKVLAKKLHRCQDPEKQNLKELKNRNRGGGIVQSQTRDTSHSIFSDQAPGQASAPPTSAERTNSEHAAKRRKVEQEETARNASDPFGPEIVKPS